MSQMVTSLSQQLQKTTNLLSDVSSKIAKNPYVTHLRWGQGVRRKGEIGGLGNEEGIWEVSGGEEGGGEIGNRRV